MENENNKKNNFLHSLEEDLKKNLKILDIENKNKLENCKSEMAKVVEMKLKNFYYWLFGAALILLIIITAGFFYLQNLLVRK